MAATVYVRKHRTWVVVVDYGNEGSSGHRYCCWVEDREGGWGVGPTAEAAIAQCAHPVTYRSKREAEAAAAEERLMLDPFAEEE